MSRRRFAEVLTVAIVAGLCLGVISEVLGLPATATYAIAGVLVVELVAFGLYRRDG